MAVLPGPAHRKRRSSVSSLNDKARPSRGLLRSRRLVLILFGVSLFVLVQLYRQATSARDAAQLHLAAADQQKDRLARLFNAQLPPDTIFTTPSRDQNLVGDLPFVRLGSKLTDLVAPGWSKDDTYAAGTYNPALLRLPKGLEWQYIVVARAPGVYHHDNFIQMANSHAYEQSLVGFGVNRTEDGRFVAVSYETKLAIDAPGGSKCGNWAHYYGPEDPRLSWSDDMRPVLSFGQPGGELQPKACRALAYARDLRTLWPEFDAVMKVGFYVAPTMIGSAKASLFEVTTPRAQWIEKNWQMLWPGPQRDEEINVAPSFSYTPSPSVILVPTRNTTGNTVVYNRRKEQELRWYDEVQPGPHANCLSRFHHASEPKAIHHATPLYRLTLCNRGQCEPDVTNTVFITLMHLKKAGFSTKQNYGRFFSLQNVTSPFDYVAVGPEFHFDGTDDTKIVYGLSITFEPREPLQHINLNASEPSRLDIGRLGRPSFGYPRPPPPIDPVWQEARLGLSHGFLSDDAWISLGVADVGMSMIRLSVEEMIRGMRRCDGPLPPVAAAAAAAPPAEGKGGAEVKDKAESKAQSKQAPPPASPAQYKAKPAEGTAEVDMEEEEKAALAAAAAQKAKEEAGRLAAPDFVAPPIEPSNEGP